MSLCVKIAHNLPLPPHKTFTGTKHLDVSFEISAHTKPTALFGKSGAGKSTILSIIAGFVPAHSAQISLNGRLLQHTEKRLNVAAHKRKIGYIFQTSTLFPHYSVSQNLFYGFKRTAQPLSKKRCEDLIDLLDLSDLMNRPVEYLSGGEKQRICFARTLFTNPDLLLMDEPFSALDQEKKSDIYPYLEALFQETKIPALYVSHDWQEIQRLCGTIFMLEKGRIKTRQEMPQNISFQVVVRAIPHTNFLEIMLGQQTKLVLTSPSTIDHSVTNNVALRSPIEIGQPIILNMPQDKWIILERHPGRTNIGPILPVQLINYGRHEMTLSLVNEANIAPFTITNINPALKIEQFEKGCYLYIIPQNFSLSS